MPKYEALIFLTEDWPPPHDKETLQNVIEYHIEGSFIILTIECPHDGKAVIIYPSRTIRRVALREQL